MEVDDRICQFVIVDFSILIPSYIFFSEEESFVLDHSVSQSSENSFSRTKQIVEGGRCVNEQRHAGMGQSWMLR